MEMIMLFDAVGGRMQGISCAVAVLFAVSANATAPSYFHNPVDFEDLKAGEMLPARELLEPRFEHLCVLGPYQDRLDQNVPARDRINAHLFDIGYVGDEGDWALVLVRHVDVEVLRFRRSAKLELLPASETQSSRIGGLPERFTPTSCVDGGAAMFAKTEIDGRTYISLGKSSE
jgi:hypothetical protein